MKFYIMNRKKTLVLGNFSNQTNVKVPVTMTLHNLMSNEQREIIVGNL